MFSLRAIVARFLSTDKEESPSKKTASDIEEKSSHIDVNEEISPDEYKDEVSYARYLFKRPDMAKKIIKEWHMFNQDKYIMEEALCEKYGADFIAYQHTHTVTGLCYVSEEKPQVKGLNIQPIIDGEHVQYLAIPDLRIKEGKELNKEIKALNDISKKKGTFGLFFFECCGLSDITKFTMNIEEDNAVIMHVAVAEAISNNRILVGVPYGGPEKLDKPDMPKVFREISESDYLHFINKARGETILTAG